MCQLISREYLWDVGGKGNNRDADVGRMCKLHTDSSPGQEFFFLINIITKWWTKWCYSRACCIHMTNMKRVLHYILFGSYRLKQQGDTTIHLLGQNPKHRHHQMLARMWSKRKSRTGAEMRSGMTTFEDSLVVSYKLHSFTLWSSDCAFWYLYKWVENLGLRTKILCPHKNLCVDF